MTLSMLRPRPIAQRFHRAPTPQERGDELLMQWRLARAAGIPATNRLDREGRRRVQDRAGCAGGPDMIEISQEAQIALAELSKRKARERLHGDGASSIPAMQRRIKALAAERSIPSRNC